MWGCHQKGKLNLSYVALNRVQMAVLRILARSYYRQKIEMKMRRKKKKREKKEQKKKI
jgi:hypothetical protein